MAAAQRTRRRTHLLKRRKQTMKKKTQRRRLLPKRRKPQLKRRRPQPKRRKLPVLKPSSNEFISKVLRQLNRDRVWLSTKAKGKMISFIRMFYKNVSKQAKRSNNFQRIPTIGSKELQNALKPVMHKDQATALVRSIRKVSHHCRR